MNIIFARVEIGVGYGDFIILKIVYDIGTAEESISQEDVRVVIRRDDSKDTSTLW